jgi:hypothetical protein
MVELDLACRPFSGLVVTQMLRFDEDMLGAQSAQVRGLCDLKTYVFGEVVIVLEVFVAFRRPGVFA